MKSILLITTMLFSISSYGYSRGHHVDDRETSKTMEIEFLVYSLMSGIDFAKNELPETSEYFQMAEGPSGVTSGGGGGTDDNRMMSDCNANKGKSCFSQNRG